MFGEKIDYLLLKTLAHDRRRATEAELDGQARRSAFSMEQARAYLEKVMNVYFDGRLSVDPSLSYLDIGCGIGRLSIGLALAGARDVTGVDIVERHVAEAEAISARLAEAARPRFLHRDIHDWKPDRQYDVVFVLGAMEHIRDPVSFLADLPRFLKPTGLAFVSHEPFQSPIGDHMSEFFRIQIPWRGLLFSEKAILRLRAELFRPTDPATRYQDIAGGLNLMSFSRYLEWARQAGLEFVFHNFNPQLKHRARLRPLHPFSWVLTHIPKVQDYFIICGYSIMKRRV